jgi:hypothetical protein
LSALSTRPSPIAAIPALLLVVVALWETCATPRYAAAVPGDKAWALAADVVRAGYQPGDLIVFAPGWVDPVGRLHLGDLIPVEMAARDDGSRYGRIWELSIRGERARETRGLTAVQSSQIGGIAIRRYEQTPTVVLADLRAELPRARVTGPVRASVELTEVGFEPHRCIQVIPPPKQGASIVFPGLRTGTKLVGYVGLADIFTRRSPRGPGTLRVRVGSQLAAEVTAGIDDGWVRFEAATQPGTADITVELAANEPNRLICFTAETRQ